MRKNYFNLILDRLRKKDYFGEKYLLIGVIVLIILILIIALVEFTIIARVDLSPTQIQDYPDGIFASILRWLGLYDRYGNMGCEDLEIKIIKNVGAKGACNELNKRICEDKNSYSFLCEKVGVRFGERQ